MAFCRKYGMPMVGERNYFFMRDMTVGKESKHIFYFSLPLLLGNLFQQLYNVVDTWVVGRAVNGDSLLAAVGTSFPIMFLLISMMLGMSMGVTILISQYFGAGDMGGVKRTVSTAYLFAFFLSLGLTAIGLMLSKPLLLLLHTPAEIFPHAKSFLDIMFIGIVTTAGYNFVSAILRGIGDSKTPLLYVIVATVINVVLDIWFVWGLGWGVVGAAWATVIAQLSSFVFSIIHLNMVNDMLRIGWKDLKIDPIILKQLIRVGVPSGLQQTAVSIGMLLVQGRINYFGRDVMAAVAAATKIEGLAFLPVLNFNMAVSAFVGQNAAAGKFDRVAKGYHATLIMTVVVSAILAGIILLFGRPMMEQFNKNPNVVAIGQNYLLITCSFYFLASLMFSTTGVIRGAGDAFGAMIFTIISLWFVRVPAAYLLSATAMGPSGIWLSQPLGWLVGSVAVYIYYRKGRWKEKVLVHRHG